MSDQTVPAARRRNRQLLLVGAVFAVVLAVLATGYFFFLQPRYVVLAQDLRPAEAKAVIAELDKQRIAWRLRDGGATVLVSETDADATRLALAGSDVTGGGQIGFELFNKSDMGLTNFAQRINYQRALQGELVRTIEAMDGVESARVHLALPERTLFRSERAEPKAAVTIALRPGAVTDTGRVAGIQRLVAAAVPDLPESAVVVLDSAGRVISAAPAANTDEDLRPVDLAERQAIEAYYQTRTRRAIDTIRPGLAFRAQVMALPLEAGAAIDTPAENDSTWAPAEAAGARNFRLRVQLVTPATLGPEDQALLRNAVAQTLSLDPARGDSVVFEVGPINPGVAQPLPAASALPDAPAPRPSVVPTMAESSTTGQPFPWIVLIGGIALLSVALLGRRFGARRSGAFGSDEQEAFAQRLRRQLNMAAGTGDAAS